MCDKSRQYCSVPQCKSIRNKDVQLSFHRFPESGKFRVKMKNKNGGFEMVDARKAWQSKLRIGKPISKYMSVCSLHFKEEDYIPRSANVQVQRRKLKKIAVPSLKLPVLSIETKDKGLQSSSSSSSTISNKTKRVLSRKLLKYKYMFEPEGTTDLLESDKMKVQDIIENSEQDLKAAGALLQLQNKRLLKIDATVQVNNPKIDVSVQVNNPKIDVSVQVNNPTIDAGVQVNTPKIETLSALLKTNRDLSSFTGISNFQILDVIVQAVDMVYKDQRMRRLSLKDRIILVFVKLKLNLSYHALSVLFSITESLSKTYFCELTPILGKILAQNIPFPDLTEIAKIFLRHSKTLKMSK